MKKEMVNCPDVAILMATYNGEKYLEQQFDSLLNQTYKNFCCYIHDDSSTDGTREVIDNYAEKYPDRIRVINGKKCGGSKENFLFLLNKVEADYYFFCDQDDVWMPKKIEICLEELKKKPTNMPISIYTNLEVVDEKLELINHSFYEYSKLNPFLNTYKSLLMSNVCVGCTMGFNRILRDIVVDFESENIMMHDWEIALMASLLGELDYINTSTIQYRQHQNNILGAAKEKGILGKLVRAFDLRGYIDRKKYYKTRPIKMAGELLKLPGLDDEKRKFLRDFSDISNRNKFGRINFYRKNKLYRQRINKIWQMINT